METRRVSPIWGGARRDILTLLLDDHLPPYGADISDQDDRVILYRALDARDEATGDIVGVEIDDFAGVERDDSTGFDHWDALADLPPEWRFPGEESFTVVESLKRVQRALQATVPTPTTA